MERLSQITITGSDGFINQSSIGSEFVDEQDPATVISHGFNTESGYVTRFTGIDPGSDGEFTISGLKR